MIPRSKPTQTVKPNLTGKASGKRTLADVMDNDLERKKRRRKSPTPVKNQVRQSKFFAESRSCSVRRRHSEGELGLSGPSHQQGDENKENEYIVIVDDDDELDASQSDLEGSDISLKAQIDASDVFSSRQLDVADFPELVEQEDGYISPPDYTRDADDLSSPVRPEDRRKTIVFREDEEMSPSKPPSEEDFAQILSSPMSVRCPIPSLQRLDDCETPVKWAQNAGDETILAYPTPTPTKRAYQESEDVPSPTLFRGPDLRSMLGADCCSELDRACEAGSGSSSTTSPTPSPDTPAEGHLPAIDVEDCGLDLEVEEEQHSEQTALRTKAVMDGWRRKWSLPSLQAEKSSINSPKVFALGSGALRATNLRRSETTVIMADSHSTRGGFYKPPKSAPSKVPGPSAPRPRKGKLVFESTKVSSTALKASKTVASVTSPKL